jgi:hypothetical protein
MTMPHVHPPRRWHRSAGCFVLLALTLTAIARTEAHPASDTSVVIAFRSREAVEIAVASDASALVTKLEALAGTPFSAPSSSRDALAARLTSLGATLSDHACLTIDGMRVSTQPGAVFVDDRGLATMHLAGEMEPVASQRPDATLSWSTDLMYGTYPLVIRRSDGRETIYWLDGRASSGPIPLSQLTQAHVSVLSGLWLGFTHIVPKGLDHILFVLGLFLLCPVAPSLRTRTLNQEPGTRTRNPGTRNPEPHVLRQLIWQVSAFTVAHTVTLGLSLYGLVEAPGNVVEPLIALSVAYVGVENLFTSRLHPWRVVVVFAFGLLHGLGFAGAMSELPYSHADLLGMLVSFNVGVELGQLAVIAGAALVMHVVQSYRRSWQRPATQLASAYVGLMGLVWTIERLVA